MPIVMIGYHDLADSKPSLVVAFTAGATESKRH